MMKRTFRLLLKIKKNGEELLNTESKSFTNNGFSLFIYQTFTPNGLFMKDVNGQIKEITSVAKLHEATLDIKIGTGDQAVSWEDINLQGAIYETTDNVIKTSNETSDHGEYTISKSFTNNATETIEIKESGLFVKIDVDNSGEVREYLVARDVFPAISWNPGDNIEIVYSLYIH
jgi:hypothetical protein